MQFFKGHPSARDCKHYWHNDLVTKHEATGRPSACSGLSREKRSHTVDMPVMSFEATVAFLASLKLFHSLGLRATAGFASSVYAGMANPCKVQKRLQQQSN